jgi:hypothetical protein
MSFTWNPRLVKTPTPIMSAMTIAVAVAVDTVARFELPLLAGIIDLLAKWGACVFPRITVGRADADISAAEAAPLESEMDLT